MKIDENEQELLVYFTEDDCAVTILTKSFAWADLLLYKGYVLYRVDSHGLGCEATYHFLAPMGCISFRESKDKTKNRKSREETIQKSLARFGLASRKPPPRAAKQAIRQQ